MGKRALQMWVCIIVLLWLRQCLAEDLNIEVRRTERSESNPPNVEMIDEGGRIADWCE